MRNTLSALESELNFRIDGLQWTIEESIPQMIGVLVLHLARNGQLDLSEFGRDVRACHGTDPRLEDGTGKLFAALGDLMDYYRDDDASPARREPIFKTDPGRPSADADHSSDG